MPVPNVIPKVLLPDSAMNRFADQLIAVLNPILRNVNGDLKGPVAAPTVVGWFGLPLDPSMALPALNQVPKWNGSAWVPGTAGTTGAVTAVTATGPIASSGGTTPNISLTGFVPIANGGTNGNATPTAGAVPYGTGSSYDFSAAGLAGQVLLSGGAGVPTWATKYFNPAPGTAGRILYDSGTDWVALAAGTSGQFLKTNGAGSAPSWANGNAGTVTSVGFDLSSSSYASVANPTSNVVISLSIGTSPGRLADGADNRFNVTPGIAGRIPYDTGLAWAALAAGTSGQLLSSNGAAAPSWLTPSASTTGAGIGTYRATTSTPDTISLSDYVVDVNTTGSFTVNLPTAGASAGQAPSGRIFIVKNSGGANVTVTPAGAQLIDGASTFTIITQYASFTFISTGSGWALL